MKTAFITGGGRGLGKGFAEYFLNEGFTTIIGVRQPDKIDKILKSNKNLIIVKLDVSSDKSIKKAFEKIKSVVDHLDFLINNAGLNKKSATNNKKELVSSLNRLDRQSLLNMFNVNTISPMIVVKEFLPLLTGNQSFVINISSGRSSYKDEYPNSEGNYGYRASKSALNMITFCTLHDLPNNVKIFAVHPGGVKTEMNPTGEHNAVIQAERIISITKNWKEKFNGKFLRFDGSLYPL